MSLPRFHVEVSGGPAAANDPDQPDRLLTVDVMGASGAGGRAPYPIGSTKVEVAGRSLWVPFVPTTMRQAHNPRLDALCAGDKAALRTLLGRLARQRPKGNDVLLYGRWLFECLLAPAWPALCRDPEVVAAGGVELALMWDARHADLHSLVWEAMIDDQDRPLAGLLDMLVVVTRVVPVSYPAPATIEHAPRVLFASGASLTDEVIRPGAMFMGLLRKFDAEGICVSRAGSPRR